MTTIDPKTDVKRISKPADETESSTNAVTHSVRRSTRQRENTPSPPKSSTDSAKANKGKKSDSRHLVYTKPTPRKQRLDETKRKRDASHQKMLDAWEEEVAAMRKSSQQRLQDSIKRRKQSEFEGCKKDKRNRPCYDKEELERANREFIEQKKMER